jgi:hypothetical protein
LVKDLSNECHSSIYALFSFFLLNTVNFKALDSCSLYVMLKSHSTLEQLCLALPSQELSNELLPFKHIEPPTSNIHCFAKAQSSHHLL